MEAPVSPEGCSPGVCPRILASALGVTGSRRDYAVVTNVLPFHRPDFSADAFNRARAIDDRPQRLGGPERGWVVIADPQAPGIFDPGAELLDLRQATSEREAVLAACRYCDDTCRDGPDPALG